jgi:hypothetical protein
MLSEQFKRERFTNAINVIKSYALIPEAQHKQANARISILVDKIYRACKDDEELFRHLAKEELTDYEANRRQLATAKEKNEKTIDMLEKALKASDPE